jgi:hypothetical protein
MDVEAVSAKPRLRLLLDHFAKIKDTRQGWKVAYPLREVLFLVVCGTIASGDDYESSIGARRICHSCAAFPSSTSAFLAPIGWAR